MHATGVGEAPAIRLGLIVPTSNTVNETEWWRLSAPGVSVHTARIHLSEAHGEGDALPPALTDAMGRLLPAGTDVIAYACTAGSMVQPLQALPTAMQAHAGVPCTSTAAAIVAALKQQKVERVAVATPYHDELNRQWQTFLRESGIEVSTIRGLGIGAGGPEEFPLIARLPLDEVLEHAISTFEEAPAQALLLSCTDMPSLQLVEPLEERLGVPVITSNTATLWDCLRLAGYARGVAGAGVLLQPPVAA